MKLFLGASRIEEMINAEDYPFLNKLGVSFKTDYDFTCMLGEIDRLAQKVESVDLKKVRYMNDKTRSVIFVPRSSNKKAFLKQVGRTGWLTSLLDALKPEASDDMGDKDDNVFELDVDDKNIRSRADAIRMTCLALANLDIEEFTKAADQLGLVHKGSKFTAEEFQAMCEQANVGPSGQDMIRRHFLAKDFKAVFPSRRSVDQLKKGALVPKTAKAKLGTQTYDYSYKEVDDLVKHYLLQQYQSTDKKSENVLTESLPTSMELMFGGDHGQGAFRLPVKFIFRFPDNSKKELEVLMGEVICKKDTYD